MSFCEAKSCPIKGSPWAAWPCLLHIVSMSHEEERLAAIRRRSAGRTVLRFMRHAVEFGLLNGVRIFMKHHKLSGILNKKDVSSMDVVKYFIHPDVQQFMIFFLLRLYRLCRKEKRTIRRLVRNSYYLRWSTLLKCNKCFVEV